MDIVERRAEGYEEATEVPWRGRKLPATMYELRDGSAWVVLRDDTLEVIDEGGDERLIAAILAWLDEQ